ncbi:PilN domain-containing protein [Agaribacterium haliotis]|uniref:PilN domain-containing protein n=1 Tax=Agaribacterium haliotis TaxID=2013869 RepID=UPI000BB59F80|nr:PilN domain-containing protein [Agaribacterium haliotis]
MARINLLPWREELRQEKKKEFLTQLVGVVIVVALGCYLWVQTVDSSIEGQKTRNRMLTDEIASLQKQVTEIKELKKKKKELEERMRVIQDLEGKRSIIVHYFDELTKNVPDGVYFTSVRRRGNLISIEGVSESNQRISALMRNLNQSPYFANPNLKSVTAKPELGGQAGVFLMDLDATQPSADKEGKTNG